MQSIERIKAVRMKSNGISARRRLMTSEARMLRDGSAQQKQWYGEVGEFLGSVEFNVEW